MDAHVPQAIISGYENLIAGLDLPDQDDRHVLAAAIHGRVDIIVTYDLKDFPNNALIPHGIGAQHPDLFIAHLFELDPQAVIESARRHRSRLTNPPISAEEFVRSLERLQLPLSAQRLRFACI
jgi:predicted nucleic acid-binding protein